MPRFSLKNPLNVALMLSVALVSLLPIPSRAIPLPSPGDTVTALPLTVDAHTWIDHATVGSLYTQTLHATGGTAPYLWTFIGGSRPAGISLHSDGTVTGIPRTHGLYIFEVLVTDHNFNSAQQEVELIVNTAPVFTGRLIALTPITPVTSIHPLLGYVGTTTTPSLPTRLLPTLGPAFHFDPTITLPHGRVGQTYIQSIHNLIGGQAPFAWSPLDGGVPSGLTFTDAGGFRGTPTTAGTYTFDVQVMDDNFEITRGHETITIDPPVVLRPGDLHPVTPPAPFTVGSTHTFIDSTFTPPLSMPPAYDAPHAAIGQRYAEQLHVTGGDGGVLTWTVAGGELPPGTRLIRSGSIEGTPTQHGLFLFDVVVTDGHLSIARQRVRLIVNTYRTTSERGAAQLDPMRELPHGVIGHSYATTLPPLGGRSPFTWHLLYGEIPNGVHLNSSNGHLNGVPSAHSLNVFDIGLVDDNYTVATQTERLIINTRSFVHPPTLPVHISRQTLHEGVAGEVYADQLIATHYGRPPFQWSLPGRTGTTIVSSIRGLFPPVIIPELMLDPVHGTVHGTTPTEGKITFDVQVRDDNYNVDRQTLQIVVQPRYRIVGGSATPTSTTTGLKGTGSTSSSSAADTFSGMTIADLDASVSPVTQSTCKQTFFLTGHLTTNGPGSVTYHWLFNDGSVSPDQTLLVSGAGTTEISGQRDLSTSGLIDDSATLVVTSPNSITSKPVAFHLSCTSSIPPNQTLPPNTNANASLMVDGGIGDKADCGTHRFTFTGSISNGLPGDVKYQWVRSDGVTSAMQVMTFTAAGSNPVSYVWDVSDNFSGWLKLVLVSPNSAQAEADISLTQNCQATTNGPTTPNGSDKPTSLPPQQLLQ